MSFFTAAPSGQPQKKKDWLAQGLVLAEAGGFDPRAIGIQRLIEAVYKKCSQENVKANGDDCRLFFPASVEIFAAAVLQECGVRNIQRLPPKFDLLEELKKIDPAYSGEGSRKDVFNILAAAIQDEDPQIQNAVEEFRLAASQQKKQEFSYLASMVTGIRSMIFR